MQVPDDENKTFSPKERYEEYDVYCILYCNCVIMFPPFSAKKSLSKKTVARFLSQKTTNCNKNVKQKIYKQSKITKYGTYHQLFHWYQPALSVSIL